MDHKPDEKVRPTQWEMRRGKDLHPHDAKTVKYRFAKAL